MENFLNVDAKGVNPSKISGADIGAMIGGQVVSSVIAGAFGRADAKKTRQLQEEMAKLDLAQQKQLAERLQNVQGEIAKQQAYYEFMAVQNNNEMLNRIQSKRYTSYIVLGVGVLALAFVIVALKRKKNG
jgi:hypothetical protein